MLKRALKAILTLSIIVLNFVAFANVAAASSIITYEPEVPEQLRSK